MTAFTKGRHAWGQQRDRYKFTVKKAGIYEISFIYAQNPQKQKEEEKLSEEVFPRYGSDEFTKWFCRKTTAAKLAGYYGYTTQGVPEPIGTSEEEKAACTGEKYC